MSLNEIIPVVQARERISEYTKKVATDPSYIVYYGSHRKAQAAIVSAHRLQHLLEVEQRMKRQQAVDTALASARLEGAEPSEIALKDSDAFVAGEINEEELIARTRARYGLE